MNKLYFVSIILLISNLTYAQKDSSNNMEYSDLYFGGRIIPGIGMGVAYGNAGEYVEYGPITEVGLGIQMNKMHYVLYFNDFSNKIKNTPPNDTAWYKGYLMEGSGIALGVGYQLLGTERFFVVPMVMVGHNSTYGSFNDELINSLSKSSLLLSLSVAADFRFNFREFSWVNNKKNLYYNFIRLHNVIHPNYFSNALGESGGLYYLSICIGFNYIPNW